MATRVRRAALITDPIERARMDNARTWTDMNFYREYAAGEQAEVLSPKQREILQGLTTHKYCDNICHTVIAEARDRVIFEGWECKNKEVSDFLGDLFGTARVAARSGSIHYDTFRDGNYAVIVDYDEETSRVELYLNKWWNGESGVFVEYGDNDRPEYAVKEWTELDEDGAERRRRTIYYPDHIERYWAKVGGTQWTSFSLPEDEGKLNKDGHVKWINPKTGRPLGIPVIHFADSGKGIINYGASELAGGILALQDQLTSIQWDLVAGTRMTAFQIYFATGVQENETHKVGPGQFWSTTGQEAKFGAIPAGDMSQMLSVYSNKLSRAAQMTSTAYYVITGEDWPSGEAIIQAEKPAVGKANNQIRHLNDCWVLVAHRATELMNAFGGTSYDEDIKTAMITARFAPPDRRDLLSKSVIVNNLGERISDEQALRMMGFNEEQIGRIIKEKKAKQDADAERQATLFSQGKGAGTDLPGRGSEDAG